MVNHQNFGPAIVWSFTNEGFTTTHYEKTDKIFIDIPHPDTTYHYCLEYRICNSPHNSKSSIESRLNDEESPQVVEWLEYLLELLDKQLMREVEI